MCNRRNRFIIFSFRDMQSQSGAKVELQKVSKVLLNPVTLLKMYRGKVHIQIFTKIFTWSHRSPMWYIKAKTF